MAMFGIDMLDFFGVVSSMTQDPRPGSVHESHQPKGAFLEGKSLKIPHRFALFFLPPQNGSHLMIPALPNT